MFDIGDRVIVTLVSHPHDPNPTYRAPLEWVGEAGVITGTDQGTRYPYEVRRLADETYDAPHGWVAEVRPYTEGDTPLVTPPTASLSVLELLTAAPEGMSVKDFRDSIDLLKEKGWLIQ